jgi:hypothetical protein
MFTFLRAEEIALSLITTQDPSFVYKTPFFDSTVTLINSPITLLGITIPSAQGNNQKAF